MLIFTTRKKTQQTIKAKKQMMPANSICETVMEGHKNDASEIQIDERNTKKKKDHGQNSKQK